MAGRPFRGSNGSRRPGLQRCLAGAGCIAALVLVTGYIHAETYPLRGDFGYVPQLLNDLPRGAVVDATTATFRVANSGVQSPTGVAPCDTGVLPVNRYPLQIRKSARVTLRGGRFAGEVPVTSDWQDTYCNSAAVALRDSPDAIVEGLRMRRLWDAVRVGKMSGGFMLRRSWISEVRDDCLENDYLQAGSIVDVLFDGCFAGISTRPPKGKARRRSEGDVVLLGVLMRMGSYKYKSREREALPLKADDAGPRFRIYHSIIAMGNPDNVSKSRLSIGWSMIDECGGNLLLWTSDEPWPEEFGAPPSCFRLVTGREARVAWAAARQNWIDCHPDILRFNDDDAPSSDRCRPNEFGGAMFENPSKP